MNDVQPKVLTTVRGASNGSDFLLIGAEFDTGQQTPDDRLRRLFDDGAALEVLPLTGDALPYPDQSFDLCRVLPPVLHLGARHRDAVLREAHRVAYDVIPPRVFRPVT